MPRDADAGRVLDGVDDPIDVDVVADVAAALADVDGEAGLAHADADAFRRSRCAATWAAAAPACRIDSGMSRGPETAPATKTPGMLVAPGLKSSSTSST